MTELRITFEREEGTGGKRIYMKFGSTVIGDYIDGAIYSAPLSDVRRACRQELEQWKVEETSKDFPGHTIERDPSGGWDLCGPSATFCRDDEDADEVREQAENHELQAKFFRWVLENHR